MLRKKKFWLVTMTTNHDTLFHVLNQSQFFNNCSKTNAKECITLSEAHFLGQDCMNEGGVGQFGSCKCHPVLLCNTHSNQNNTLLLLALKRKLLSANKQST